MKCVSGLRVHEGNSSGRDLHAMSTRVSSSLRTERVLQRVHIFKLQLHDLVIGGVASWRTDDSVNCVFFESRHLPGDRNMVFPVLLIEQVRVGGFAKQDNNFYHQQSASRNSLLWSRSS